MGTPMKSERNWGKDPIKRYIRFILNKNVCSLMTIAIAIILGSFFVGVQGTEITFYQKNSSDKFEAISKHIVPKLSLNASTKKIDPVMEKQYQTIDGKEYQIIGDLEQKIEEKYFFLEPNDDKTQLYRVSATLLSLTCFIETVNDLSNDDSNNAIIIPLNLGLKNIENTFTCLSNWIVTDKIINSSDKKYSILGDKFKNKDELNSLLSLINFTLSEQESLVRCFRYCSIEYKIIDDIFLNYYKIQIENLTIRALEEYKLVYSIYSNIEKGRLKKISIMKFEPCFIYNEQDPEHGMILYKQDLNQQMIATVDELNKKNADNPNFVTNVLKTKVPFDIITKLLSKKGKFARLVIESYKKEDVLLKKNECEILKKLFKPELIRDHELLTHKKELDESSMKTISQLKRGSNRPLWFLSTLAGSLIIAMLCYFNWNQIKSNFFA